MKKVTLKTGKPVVLKSPSHTFRTKLLLEMFPDAKFVHIRRNPYTLFSSTVNLWMSLAKRHGLQTPLESPELHEKVYREFRIISESYEQHKQLIPKGNLIEVQYESFVKDLVGGTKSIYDGLQLDGWAEAEPALSKFAAGQKNYETNKYQLSDTQRAEITRRWGDLIRQQGYPIQE